MRRVKVPTLFVPVSDSDAGVTWIGPVATVAGAGGAGAGAGGGGTVTGVGGGGGVRTTGLGKGVTAGGAGGVAGGGGDATGEAVTVRDTGTRSMLLKLLGPDSTM